MGQKRVLIITYYWPPGGGAGVQRWLKFVKYLPSCGWQPVVYTPENGEMPVTDHSLSKDVPPEAEILKTRIWEPYSLYKKFVGAARDEKINTGFLTETGRPGLAERISVWMRGNFFIPDARCFWIKPSVRFLVNYLKKNPVDVIVSTGPPHSMHLIALKIANKTGLPWVADFRDPWTNIDFYKDLKLTSIADAKHRRLEQEVLNSASRVIVVGDTMRNEFEAITERNIDVITNGFDNEDIIGRSEVSKSKFVIAHIGTLVRSRNPDALWSAIAVLVQSNIEFARKLEIKLIGKTDINVRDSISRNELDEFVTYIDYLPHDEVTIQQLQAGLLLLILNDTPNAKGIITGKLFEYLSARRPILCIGPRHGDAASIIKTTGSGQTVDFDDELGIQDAIEACFQSFIAGNLQVNDSDISLYSRKSLTVKLSRILDEAVAAK